MIEVEDMGIKGKIRDRGASLIYVLIVLSIILSFSTGFVYFVKERSRINFLKERKGKTGAVSEKYLAYMEEKNSGRIGLKGIVFNGKKEFLEESSYYFNRKFIIDKMGNNKLERLIFLGKGNESIGNFKIKEIKDEEGVHYLLPLDRNTVYKTLEVIYSKKILNKEIVYKEEISFKRQDAVTVEIIERNGKFVLNR